jgi:hypothetical protein
MRNRIFLNTFLIAVFVLRGASQTLPCDRSQGEKSLTQQITLFLTTDRTKYSLSQSMVLNVGIRNDGHNPVYVYGDIAWGYGGGLVLKIKDQSGNDVVPELHDDTMLPPPRLDDPRIFVRLIEDNFFGTRRVLPLKDVIRHPGKYTLRVEYKSPLSCAIVDPTLQKLPALWHENASVFSNTVSFEVTP